LSDLSFLFIFENKHPAFLEDELRECRTKGLNITGLNLSDHLNGIDLVRHLEFLYCAKNEQVMRSYDYIKEVCGRYDVVIIYGTLKLTPRFIKEGLFTSQIIYWATDDPVSTSFATLPFIHVSDYVFTQTPLMAEDASLVTYLQSLTSVPIFYQPFGYLNGWKNNKLDREILDHKRDIPISFVGSPSWRKDLLLDCKKKFGKRLHIYSRDWNFLRHLYYDFIKNGVFHYVPSAKNESEIYMRSDISINSNAYGGPSTSRTFHLPVCGALQVCDFEDGLKECFEINKHVFSYKNLDSADLISKLDDLLSSSIKERMELRRESYLHVTQNFRFSSLLSERLGKIF